MKKILKISSAIIFLVLGLSMFIYPYYTDKEYKNNVSKKEKEYTEYIDSINEIINNGISASSIHEETSSNITNTYNKFNELYELLKARNEKLYQTKQNEFIYNTNYEVNDIILSNYGLKYNIFGYIELPSIGITLPIYLGATNSNMKLGAVHLTGTSYPIGGINTNSVIAAHRGYHRTKMFRDIDKINIGDSLYIKNFTGTLTYKAVKTDVIDKKGISNLTIEEGRDMITIISCHPYPFNYQRYVVYFERA